MPTDVSLVLYDDILYAAVCAPDLTTVAMPTEEAGRAAGDLLLRSESGDSSPASHYRLAT